MKKIALILLAIATSGCSTISSTSLSSSPVADGLLYHLPKSDLVITVEVDDKRNPIKVTATTTALYPDSSASYLLRHTNGLVGKHTIDIKLKNGLLSSVNAKLESRFTDAMKALGAAAALNLNIPFTNDCAPGVHTFIKPIAEALQDKQFKYCNNRVTIDFEMVGLPLERKPAGAQRPSSLDSADGVYYRQNLPFIVNVETDQAAADGSSKKNRSASLIWSPAVSPTFFLPVSRGLLADAESAFSFEDGIPTQIKYTTDSEATALLKLPAEIASAYFSAVGSLFSNFNTNATSQKTLLENTVKLELTKKRYEACIAAIQAKDDELIKSLGCGTDG